MSLTIKEISASLRNVPLSLKALLANFVLVSLVAEMLLRSFHLEHRYALGLVLLATAAVVVFILAHTTPLMGLSAVGHHASTTIADRSWRCGGRGNRSRPRSWRSARGSPPVVTRGLTRWPPPTIVRSHA
jgi:hypothetical protein